MRFVQLNEAIANRLCRLLDEKNMTAYGLFIKSGVSQSAISDLKKMNSNGVNVRISYEISEGLGVSSRELFDSPLLDDYNILD